MLPPWALPWGNHRVSSAAGRVCLVRTHTSALGLLRGPGEKEPEQGSEQAGQRAQRYSKSSSQAAGTRGTPSATVSGPHSVTMNA